GRLPGRRGYRTEYAERPGTGQCRCGSDAARAPIPRARVLPEICCLIPIMENPNSTDQRLTALEVKATFADDLLDKLNQTVFRQQEQIDRLTRELLELR